MDLPKATLRSMKMLRGQGCPSIRLCKMVTSGSGLLRVMNTVSHFRIAFAASERSEETLMWEQYFCFAHTYRKVGKRRKSGLLGRKVGEDGNNGCSISSVPLTLPFPLYQGLLKGLTARKGKSGKRR